MSPKGRNEQSVYARNQGLFYRAAFSGGNILYEGWAFLSGKAISDDDEVFQICKHTHDGDNNLTKTEWAENSDDFRFSWTQRATYF